MKVNYNLFTYYCVIGQNSKPEEEVMSFIFILEDFFLHDTRMLIRSRPRWFFFETRDQENRKLGPISVFQHGVFSKSCFFDNSSLTTRERTCAKGCMTWNKKVCQLSNLNQSLMNTLFILPIGVRVKKLNSMFAT